MKDAGHQNEYIVPQLAKASMMGCHIYAESSATNTQVDELLCSRNDDKSRMTGDCHVRFCERLAGATPACLLGVTSVPHCVKTSGS